MKTTYLVIVHPASPTFSETQANNVYTNAKSPQIKRVTAENPQRAVEMVTVEPGGHALVIAVKDVVRFDRAKQAPLEQRKPDGNPMDIAIAA